MRKTASDVRVEMDKEAKKRKADYGGFEKYEVEDWASTLQRAAEIIGDPKKMKAVSKCLAMKERSMSLLKSFTKTKVKSEREDPAA